jgi:hypothetical protein
MSKAPKILRYDWSELTGLIELESNELEELRLMFRNLLTSSPNQHRSILQHFFEGQATYLLLKPTSDLAVSLYRLLEQYNLMYLSEVVAIRAKAINFSFDLDMSFGQFIQLVESSFVFRQRPIPVVSGLRTMINL